MQPRTAKIVFAICIISVVLNVGQLVYFQYLRPSVLEEDSAIQISDLWKVENGNYSAYIGKKVTLEGYLIEDGYGDMYLIEDSSDYLCDKVIEQNKIIPLTGLSTIRSKLSAGMFVSMKGTILAGKATNYPISLDYERVNYRPGVSPWTPSIEIMPSLNMTSPKNGSKYAVLFSGGVNQAGAYLRYWNHIKFLYTTLVNKYNYNPNNIIVIYKNGTGEDSTIPIDGAATYNNLNNVFNDLSSLITQNDDLLFYSTNHGSKEGLCLFMENTITPTEFNTMINQIKVWHHKIIIMNQCFSGLFLNATNGVNTVITTAAQADEVAWAMQVPGFSTFSYYWICAVNGETPEGDPVDADTNDDGKVSMSEAFNYVKSYDKEKEHPQFEDSGDGVSTGSSLPSGDEGKYGDTVFL